MLEFQKLYKRTKVGAIQEYSVSVKEDSLKKCRILKNTGRFNGKLTNHVEVVTEGKQGRNVYEQAKFKANAYWKEKKDEGYKTVDELHVKYCGYHADKPLYNFEVNYGSLEEMLDKALPTFNTTSEGHAKPMLAIAIEKIKKELTYPVLIQPKLDGVRATIEIDLEGLTCLVISRSGKYYDTMTHVTDAIIEKLQNNPEARKALYQFVDCDYTVILDGEIYSDELSFQSIVSEVKKISPNNHLLKFRMYDVVNDETQEKRIDIVKTIVDIFENPDIRMVETAWVSSREVIKDMHDNWVKQGYEGAMVRIPSGIYGKGQRSRDLIKVKEFDETEFTFSHFVFGERKEDLIGVFLNKDKVVFRAKVMGNSAYKEKLYKNCPKNTIKEFKVTIKHFGYTDDGLPRFPVAKAFRDYE